MPHSDGVNTPPLKSPVEDRIDPALEAVRQQARAAVRDASLRLVAKEIGISHTALSDFIRTEEPRVPYGPARLKLIGWFQQRTGPSAGATRASYFRGKQDALMGMIQYIATQQAEIGTYLGEIDSERPRPAKGGVSPTVDEAEEAEAILDRLPPLPAKQPQQKKRRA